MIGQGNAFTNTKEAYTAGKSVIMRSFDAVTKSLLSQYVAFMKRAELTRLTITEYLGDARSFCGYCADHDIQLAQATVEDVTAWISVGARGPISLNTQARKLSALRKFFDFLLAENLVQSNFVMDIPHPERSLPPPKMILPKRVISDLLSVIRPTPLGRRDIAMVHCMYSGALDVCELVALKVNDVDLRTGALTVDGSRRATLNTGAREALRVYIQDIRPRWVRDPDMKALFVGDAGEEAITRQAVWKRMANYGAMLNQPISPKTIRDSAIAHAAEEDA